MVLRLTKRLLPFTKEKYAVNGHLDDLALNYLVGVKESQDKFPTV